MMTGFVILAGLIHFVYTLNFAIKFNTTPQPFSRGNMLLHNILIWIIPFIWIVIIKVMAPSTPGSHHFKKRKKGGSFYESEIGFLGSWHDSHSGGDGNDTGGGGDD
jgi:hypothetical protein